MLTLLLLVVAFVLFFTELIPIAFTALMVSIVLSITRILDANTAFSYFGYKSAIVFLIHVLCLWLVKDFANIILAPDGSWTT